MSSLRPIRELLHNEQRSPVEVMERARRLSRLARKVADLLPSPLADHCRLANVRDNALILQTDSAAWATRLRYAAPMLLKRLRREADLNRIEEVRIRVRPPSSRTPRSPANRPRLSAASAGLLRQAADACSDPKLGQALRRLADRGG